MLRKLIAPLAGVAASVLALFLGFVFWLLIRRWINELVGDIRGRRFLDDARSEPGSRPLLTQIRRVLREVETTQRLEIDFHENWTPQALQQVVRDHLGRFRRPLQKHPIPLDDVLFRQTAVVTHWNLRVVSRPSAHSRRRRPARAVRREFPARS